jgi:phosphatidylserine synthase
MSTLERQRSTTNGQSATTPRLEYPEVAYDYEAEKGEGWRVFAAIMLGFAGILGLIDGIVAVSKSSFYVAGAHFVFSDLHTWGWIIMAVGAIATLSAFGVMNRAQWARWFGIAVAGTQAIAQLLMIQAYPFWSLCVFAIDVLVIYALATYGGSRTRKEA